DNGTNGTIGSCYNYDGTNNTANCPIGGASMASNVSAITFFTAMQSDLTNVNGDSEVNNIWGKLYTWANASGACPSGRHLPSDAEWITLENYLAGTTCRTADGRQCDGLGWKSNVSYNPDRKLAETLKIPLAGYRSTDGLTFYNLGGIAYLWSSTPNSINAYRRDLYRNDSTVHRVSNSQVYGFSVRCLKD
ncbi:MAG: FISUMP domain-containing protein, partial [Candidatus Gracilibacteria bacterium]|nr:FISUMP domain-containing protein [Candidatus Gracilibacteria bacterium]